jgi:hypothetical protein
VEIFHLVKSSKELKKNLKIFKKSSFGFSIS